MLDFHDLFNPTSITTIAFHITACLGARVPVLALCSPEAALSPGLRYQQGKAEQGSIQQLSPRAWRTFPKVETGDAESAALLWHRS